MGFLADKRILITGLLSKHSIAYGIAKACHREGAQLAFTYQNERFQDRVGKFAQEFDSTRVYQCDVAEDHQIDALFVDLGKEWEGLDGLVHSIAFAPKEAIEGDFLDGITRESFRIAHDVSSYSYPALVKAARPLLLKGNNAAVLALSYLGAERTLPNYNTMGLAKASLEAATRYLAFASGHRAFVPMRFQPARSRRWRPPVSAISRNCWPTTRITHHCVATSRSMKSAMQQPSCFPIWPAALPPRSCTSMAGSTPQRLAIRTPCLPDHT